MMSFRQMIGFALLSIGVVLIVFGFHRQGDLPLEAVEPTAITNSPVSPTERLPTNAPLDEKVDCKVASRAFIWGMVLIGVGIGVALYYRKHGA